MKIEVSLPKTDAMKTTLKKTLKGRPSPIFLGLRASRDQFWRILGRRYLRARSRADKKRLMRDTGTTAQSYFPSQRDGARPSASIDSKYKVAAIHEDTTKSRVMTITVKSSKALFIPTVARATSKGIVPSSSGAGIPGAGAGKFVLRRTSKVTRRWPSYHALKQWRTAIDKAGIDTFEKTIVKRWDGPAWPQEKA